MSVTLSQFHVLATQTGDRYGSNAAPSKVNGRPIGVAEIFRIRASAGHDIVCARLLDDGHLSGPFLMSRASTEAWGHELEPRRDGWDITPALAASIAELIEQRDALLAAAVSLLNEVNGAGYVNRGESVVADLDALVSELKPLGGLS